jgi:hypothetical protein
LIYKCELGVLSLGSNNKNYERKNNKES